MPKEFPFDANTRALSKFDSLTPTNLAPLIQAGVGWPGVPCAFDNLFRGTPPVIHESTSGLVTLETSGGPGFTNSTDYLRFVNSAPDKATIRISANPLEQHFPGTPASGTPNSFYSGEWVGMQSIEMWVRIPDDLDFQDNADLCVWGTAVTPVAAWPTPLNVAPGFCALAYRRGPYPFRLFLLSGVVQCLLSANPGVATLIGTDITDNAWHYIAVTWDNATSGTARLYIDGVEVDNDPYSGLGQPLVFTSDGPMMISGKIANNSGVNTGTTYVTNASVMKGYDLSQWRVSSVVRTASEIFDIFNEQDALPPPPVTPELIIPAGVSVFECKDDHVTEGLSNLIEQFKDKTALAKLITVFLEQIQDAEDAVCEILFDTTIDASVGQQQDNLGAIVGELRSGRSDLQYGTALRVRILINQSNGSIEDVIGIVTALLQDNDLTVSVLESFPASFIIQILEPIDPAEIDIANIGNLVATGRPAGVAGFLFFGGEDSFQYDAPGLGYDVGNYSGGIPA